MTFLECSGLVTLVRNAKSFKQKMITLPKGTDYAELLDVNLYGEYFLTRKALIIDVKIPFISMYYVNSSSFYCNNTIITS